MLFNIEKKKKVKLYQSLRWQFFNSVKRLVFDLMKIPFLKSLIGISRLIVEVLSDQNQIFADWFSSYFQFCSDGHFLEQADVCSP